MLRLRQSKIFISFLIALVLVFSYEQSKPKALVPLAWAGYVLAGMAAETLITMGVKATSKAVLKKKADDYSAQALKNGGYDFLGTNPYRNKDGSITLTPTANDRARMAGLIGGTLIGAYIGDEMNGASCLQPNTPVIDELPVRDNAEETSKYFKGFVYTSETGVKTLRIYNRVSGQLLHDDAFNNNNWHEIEVAYFYEPEANSLAPYSVQFYAKDTRLGDSSGIYSIGGRRLALDLGYVEENKTVVQNFGSELINCDDVYFPKTVEDIYPSPPGGYPPGMYPNYTDLSDRSITIYNVMPPSETEGEINWTEIEDYYNTSGEDFQAVMDSNIENYVAKGTIVDNLYTIDEVNNIYTDVNYDKSKEEVEKEIEGYEPSVPVVPDEGEIIPVDPIDRNMLQVITESYSYLADSIDTSLEAMRGVVDGAKGIVEFLDTSFRWLPAEWRAMFGAAFILGVFAHFFRR